MLRIEPTNVTISLKSANENNPKTGKASINKEDKSMLVATLSALAAAGAAFVGLKKTSPISYEEALKKAGVEIKDNVARLVKTGEKFTGKIQRFENRNRRETVAFVDGIMTEKLYHTCIGSEIEGEFYRDNKRVLKIWKSVGQVKGHKGFAYSGEGISSCENGPFVETKDGFAWARKFLKK